VLVKLKRGLTLSDFGRVILRLLAKKSLVGYKSIDLYMSSPKVSLTFVLFKLPLHTYCNLTGS
jgi:hypothetical protein